MPIMFNTILLEAGLALADVCLLRHQDQRAAPGRTPYELWRDNPPTFDQYQSHQSIDGRSKFSRVHHWASFVATPGGETLFVGLYHVQYRGLLESDRPMPQHDAVDKAGSCDVYDLSLRDSLADLIGKLYIDCPTTKEQYVGSATGECGFWQRWQDYILTGHGGNVALKSRAPSDYRVSILQVAGTDANTDDILTMEQRWMTKLQSKEMGLNR